MPPKRPIDTVRGLPGRGPIAEAPSGWRETLRRPLSAVCRPRPRRRVDLSYYLVGDRQLSAACQAAAPSQEGELVHHTALNPNHPWPARPRLHRKIGGEGLL
jgi:hypothetical protein